MSSAGMKCVMCNEQFLRYPSVCSLQEGQSQLTVKINQWTEVSTLMQLNSEDTEVAIYRVMLFC